MNTSLVLNSNLYFTATGLNDGKKLKFSADTLLSNFNAYIVKVNGNDTQTMTLSHNDKNNKFTDNAGVWYMLGILKIQEDSVSGKTYTYTIGNGDGERHANESEAARLSIVYSTSAPRSGTNIRTNSIAGIAHITGSGIPGNFELNVKANAGTNRYAKFSVSEIQSKVEVNLFGGDGLWRGQITSETSSDNLWVDLNAFPTGFFMVAFVQADYGPDDNPNPDYPYTFNIGDPRYDGTMKYVDE